MSRNNTNDSTENPHEDYETRCCTTVGTKEVEVQINQEGDTQMQETNELCDTTLTYEEHYIGQSGVSEARRHGYEQSAMKFRCPECGQVEYRCPICCDSRTPGWFRGESSGEMLACHNCNIEEAARQERGF